MEWLPVRGRFTRGKSRGFLLLLVGLLASLFAGILITTISVEAQGGPDATWDGASLGYKGHKLELISDQNRLADMGLPDGARTYGSLQGSDMHVVYFAPGADIRTAESATYALYSYTPPDTYTEQSTSPITTEPAGENSGGLEQGTSCDIDGVGWAICPMSNWMASGMDWLYEQLTGFLSAQPLNINDTNSGMYQAWKIMLGIANAAFIIAFIIIIYSQITSLGISNYGIKKMLPRLIIAAIMVNLSFYICAIAIDLSNILGQGIQDMFISIRNTMSTVGTPTGNAQDLTWANVTSAVLAGVAGVGALILGFDGVTSAAAVMLVPLLVALLVSTMVVLVILAARQALIVILTIISPLAFVAYLLPGTEKWFDKWKDLFFTMLIFFPAFSAVFGGSQLAGAAIIQNADTIIMAILGLAVQVAPLILGPLILKLSGGLLNRLAGVMNNPGKGLVDRTRNWAENQSKYLRHKRSTGLSQEELKNKKFMPLRRAGRWANHYNRSREERIKNYQDKADAAYEATERHAKNEDFRRNVEMNKQIIQKQLDNRWNDQLEVDVKLREKDLKLRVEIDKESLSKAKLDNRYEDFKAGYQPMVGPMPESMTELMSNAQQVTRNVAIEGLRKSSTQRVQNAQLADAIEHSNDLQKRAGMIEDMYFGNSRGSQRALANALQSASSANEDAIKNADTIITHSNLSDPEIVEMAKGNAQRGITLTDDIRAAAIRNVAGGKNAFAINKLLDEIDFNTMPANFQQELGTALITNGSKPPWIGGVVSAQIKAGGMTGKSRAMVLDSMKAALGAGKLSAEVLVSTDASYLNNLKDTLTDPTTGVLASMSTETVDKLKREINKAKSDPQYSGRIGEREKPIDEILTLLP